MKVKGLGPLGRMKTKFHLQEDLQKNNATVHVQTLLLGRAKAQWGFTGFWHYNCSTPWEALAAKNTNPDWNHHNQYRNVLFYTIKIPCRELQGQLNKWFTNVNKD